MSKLSTATQNGEPILEVRNLKKYFTSAPPLANVGKYLGYDLESHVKAVDDVSFDIHENEIIGVIGESGCGKSTLGRTLVRLLEPTDGEVRFQGQNILELSGKELRNARKRIQFVFQDPSAAINPRMKIGMLIREPLKNFHNLSSEELDKRVNELLEQVDLPKEFSDRFPHELSGGQLQRVLICRALAPEPDLIIADEPVTGLDVSVQAKIINLLEEIRDEYNLSILFIAHDLSVIRFISDKTMVMYLGEIVEMGDTERIFDNPQHPYTRSLKSAIPGNRQEFKHMGALQSEPPSPSNPPSGCTFHPRCPNYIGEECEAEPPESVQLSDGRLVHCHHFKEGDDPTENLS